ncbi:MAG: hypothetical protein AAB426_01895, partial [Myxococcota bacterium]
MNASSRYLQQRQTEQERRPSLAEALLAGRFLRYAFYRMRYLGIRVLLRTGVSFGELAFFFLVASPYYFGFILVARSVCGAVATLWWGALDTLRTDVRELYATHNRPAVERLVGSWLRGAIGAGAILLLVTACAIALRVWVRDVLSIFDAYMLVCAVRISADVVTRTYHAGAYALRRVFRPLVAVLAVDVLDVLALVALWPSLGPWSFAASLLATTALSTALTWWFTRETYRSLRIGPRLRRHARRSHDATRHAVRDIALPALANSVSELDALVITLLVLGAGDDATSVAVAAFVHGVRPMIGAGYNWARLFYFDFALLARGYAGVLRRRFERLLARGAWLLGLAMWLLASGWSLIVFRGQLLWLAVLFGPMFLLRSRLSLLEIQLFSYRRYSALIATSVLLGGGLVALAWLHLTGMAMLAALVILLATSLVALRLAPAHHVSPRTLAGASLPMPLWLRSVARASAPVRVSVLTTFARPVRRSVQLIAASLASALPGSLIAPIGGRRLLLAEVGDVGTLADHSTLVGAAGGLLEAVQILPIAATGRAALDLARREGLLRVASDDSSFTSERDVGHAALRRQASMRFASVIVIDDDPRVTHERLRALAASELHDLAYDIEHAGLGATVRVVTA